MSKIDFEDLPSHIRFIFMTLANASISAYKNGMGKEEYIKFCSETWETMLINGVDELLDVLKGYMLKDLREQIDDLFPRDG